MATKREALALAADARMRVGPDRIGLCDGYAVRMFDVGRAVLAVRPRDGGHFGVYLDGSMVGCGRLGAAIRLAVAAQQRPAAFGAGISPFPTLPRTGPCGCGRCASIAADVMRREPAYHARHGSFRGGLFAHRNDGSDREVAL